MRYLLDTHTFLWMRHAPERLGRQSRALCSDAETRLSLSLASVWEMAIKASIGKLDLRDPLPEIVREASSRVGIEIAPIALSHVLRVRHLPFHHRDPFDRLLVAQCLEEGWILLSADENLDAYGLRRFW